MPFASTHFEHSPNLPDRRAHSRRPVRSLAYVELGDGNGGIALNVSEGGMAVQAVMSLSGDDLPAVRVQLSHSKKQIQLKGRVAWTGDLRKLAGVQFVDLTQETRKQIREWIALEAPESDSSESAVEPETEPGPAESTESTNVLEFQGVTHSAAEPISFPVENAEQPDPVEFTPAPRKRVTPAASVPAAFVPVAAPGPVKSADTQEDVAPAPPAAKAIMQPDSEKPISQIPPRRTPPGTPRSSTFFSANAAPSSLASPPDPTAVPDDRFGFKRTLSGPNAALTNGSPTSPEKWKMSTWIPVFILVALAAGWAAGHVTWRGGTPSAASSVANDGPGTISNSDNAASDSENQTTSASASIPSAPAEIEVLDRNNHRWTIPIQSPTGKPYGSRPAVSESAVNGETAAGLGSATLASPIAAQSSAATNNVSPPSISPAVAQASNVLPSAAADNRNIAPPQPSDTAPNNDLKPGELIHKVEPEYPPTALAQKVEGTVKVLAVIDAFGNVKSAQPLSGPQALVPAAVNAVRQWKYSPTFLGNRAIETQRQVTIVFELSKNP